MQLIWLGVAAAVLVVIAIGAGFIGCKSEHEANASAPPNTFRPSDAQLKTLTIESVATHSFVPIELAEYRTTVLAAFQNVADALRALETDGVALAAARRAEGSADETLALVRRQLELGGVNYLALRSAEQAVEPARLARLGAATSQLADSAALTQEVAARVLRRGARRRKRRAPAGRDRAPPDRR